MLMTKNKMIQLDEDKMISPTYGKVSINEITDIMKSYFDRNKCYDTPFHILVGTDSQNFSDTKVVAVIVIQCEGHGGMYFYKVQRVEKIKDVRQKLNYETQVSLSYIDKLVEILESNEKYSELYLSADFCIHVDAGQSEEGKTKELIPGIVGWIKSCGYECKVKPDSFASSTIADKISK